MVRALARALGALLLTAVSSGPALADDPVKGGTLTVALETDSRGFDAVEGGVLGSSAGTVWYTMAEQLIEYDEATGKFVPRLAEAWEASEDKKSWTFKLREGVKFHDGREFTARDAADHINRILDPENKSRSRSFITAIKGATAVDDHTIRYELAHPWVPFLGAIASPNMIGPIPSRASVEAGTQNREPVGTGPFRFKSWAGGDRIVVERNPDYWNPDAVHLDEILFRIMPDTQARFASLKAGEADVIWTDRGSTIVAAQKDPSLVTLARDGKGALINFFNASKPPLDDPRVRQALAHAWNQEAVIAVTWKGTVPFARHPLGAGSGCDAGYREYDPEKAKQLLAEYGKPVSLEMIHTTTPRGRESGELLQQFFKAVGVELKLVPVDQNTLVKKVFTNDYMISGWRIGDSLDVGPQVFALSSSNSSYNLTRLKSEALDKVAMAMRTAADPEVREAKMCELVALINDAGNMTYRGGRRYHVITASHVKNVQIAHLGVVRLWDAWVAK